MRRKLFLLFISFFPLLCAAMLNTVLHSLPTRCNTLLSSTTMTVHCSTLKWLIMVQHLSIMDQHRDAHQQQNMLIYSRHGRRPWHLLMVRTVNVAWNDSVTDAHRTVQRKSLFYNNRQTTQETARQTLSGSFFLLLIL